MKKILYKIMTSSRGLYISIFLIDESFSGNYKDQLYLLKWNVEFSVSVSIRKYVEF